MKKRLLSAMLAFVMALTLLPGTALAAEDDVAYPVTGGNIYFNKLSATIISSDNGITDVVIPSTIDGVEVLTIGPGAFAGRSSLRSIYIPQTVTAIQTNPGLNPFEGCCSLSNISVDPNNQYYCSIDSILYRYVGNGVDYNSTLELVAYPGNKGNAMPVDFQVPDNVVGFYYNAFTENSVLKSITISKNVESIGEVLRLAYTALIQSPFKTCYPLTAINVDEGNKYYSAIDGILFNKQKTTLITYPRAKQGNTYAIPNGVTEIVDFAFAYAKLASISIPDGMKRIGSYAFFECERLTSITIPASVTYLGSYVLYSCSSLKDIYYGGSEEQWQKLYNQNNYKFMGDLMDVTVHYNSTGLNNPSTIDTLGNIKYLREYDSSNRAVFFNVDILSLYTLSASADTSGIDQLIGKYVFVETDIENPHEITDVKPVESKIGTIESVGEHTLTVGGVAYPVNESLKILLNNNQKILYHVYNGVIEGYSVVEQKTGVLEKWNSTSRVATIDGKDYPTNYLTDLSFLASLDKYIGKKIEFGVSNVNDYKPLIGVDGITQEPETDDEKGFENYLVERVRAYADDTMYRQYDDIIKSDASSETKVQQLTELFVYYGFLDVQDGLVYINKTTQARSAYLALTNNEMYSCYRMWNWLNFTTAGRAMKVILIADGLTFNNELSTWLDPLTYVGAKDGPGVEKYKDMLYDFMSAEAIKIEVFETIDTISELTKNLTDAAKERANSLIKKLEKCETSEERASLLHSLEAKSIFADRASETDEGKLSFTLNDESGFGQFARAVGLATKSLSFVDIVVTDAFDIIDINSRLAVYNEYKDFLEEVTRSTDLPWEMRLAAAEIIEEFDDGVFGQIKKIAYDLVDWSGASGILEEAGLKNILTESGYTTFSDFLGAIEITSWAMNQVIDYGAISKGATFVEGYAYLSNHFLNKLINDRIAFRANQTPENAKKFINTYNILYQLRYKGEEAVLKMNKIDGLAARFTDFGYSFKEAAEKDVFAVLEGCKFEDADETMLPSSAKYKAKTVISCPVNVEIYDPNGNYITTLYDGVESDITNEYGRFSVVYRSYTDSYAKVICLKNEGNYIIKADGINSGLVNIEMCIDHSGQIESYYATDVAIDTGNSIYLEIDDIVKENEYGFDKDGDGIVDEHRKVETKPDSSDPSEPLPDDDVEYPDQTDNDGLWMYGVAGIALMAGAGLVIFLVSRKKRGGRAKKYSPMR